MYIYGSIQTYGFGYKQMILFARQLRNGNFSIEFDNNNINSNNNNRAINTIVRQNFTCIQNWRKRLTRFRFIFSLTSDFPRNFLPSPLSWRYGISLNFSIWNPDNFAYFDDIQIRREINKYRMNMFADRITISNSQIATCESSGRASVEHANARKRVYEKTFRGDELRFRYLRSIYRRRFFFRSRDGWRKR